VEPVDVAVGGGGAFRSLADDQPNSSLGSPTRACSDSPASPQRVARDLARDGSISNFPPPSGQDLFACRTRLVFIAPAGSSLGFTPTSANPLRPLTTKTSPPHYARRAPSPHPLSHRYVGASRGDRLVPVRLRTEATRILEGMKAFLTCRRVAAPERSHGRALLCPYVSHRTSSTPPAVSLSWAFGRLLSSDCIALFRSPLLARQRRCGTQLALIS